MSHEKCLKQVKTPCASVAPSLVRVRMECGHPVGGGAGRGSGRQGGSWCSGLRLDGVGSGASLGAGGGSVSLCRAGSRASTAASLPASLSQGSSHPSLPAGSHLSRGPQYGPRPVGRPSATCVPFGLPTSTAGGQNWEVVSAGAGGGASGGALTPCSWGFVGSPWGAQGSTGPARSGAVAGQGSPRGPLTAPCAHRAGGPGGAVVWGSDGGGWRGVGWGLRLCSAPSRSLWPIASAPGGFTSAGSVPCAARAWRLLHSVVKVQLTQGPAPAAQGRWPEGRCGDGCSGF